MRFSCLLLLLAAAGCQGSTIAPPPPAQPTPKIFEVHEHDKIYVDDPFDGEVVTQFRTTDVLEDLDVRELLIAGDTVYAGTASGLFRLAPAGDRFERLTTTTQPITALVLGDDGAVTGLTGARTATGAPGLEIKDLLELDDGRAVIAASTGVYFLENGALSQIEGGPWTPDFEPRALALSDGAIYVASASALTRISLADRSMEITQPGRNGLPTNDLRAVAVRSGEVMLGHGVGASALGAKIEHYHSLRWIPGQTVRAVAIGPDRTRWIGTDAGIAKVEFKPTTLLEKAEALDATFHKHIRMEGFIDDYVSFPTPYDHSGAPTHWDNDNDGLWTQMQIGTWCFAYAATGDEKYRDQARRSLEVMFLQVDVPGETFAAAGRSRGFITRSLVREDEGFVYQHKADQSNWHYQEYGGKKYYWKGDTSSDEYAGHYFGYPLYYDLCARDEAEKEEIRRRVKLATDYIIEGGYRLIDITGEPTSFGRWNDLAVAVDGIDGCPEKHPLEVCFNSWAGGGWLNGIEVLGMLLATWHMTGEQKYYDEYERLYTEEKYGQLIPITDHTLTVTDPAIANHSDHELAVLAYHTMLRYEPNADRRAIAVKSMLDFYEHEREEHNPWQVATIAAFYPHDVDLEGAVTSLRDIPLDRRHWEINNVHRLDAGHWPPDRAGAPQFDRVFPYDEINALKWNADPYNVADGWSGAIIVSPTPYLISYWTARYYGLIREP